MTKLRHCKHCGSSFKGVQCRYYWWMPYKENVKKTTKLQGKGRPCDYDAEVEENEAMMDEVDNRRINRNEKTFSVLCILAFCAVVFIVYWLIGKIHA